MSKKILFMSSAKLTAISIGLLLAVFCTIGMSFRPVYDENEAEEIVTSGPRKSHWAESDGCGGSTNNDNKDYARTSVVTMGHGTVSIKNTTKNGSLTTITTKTSTNVAGNEAVISWNCNESTGGHVNSFDLTATPDDGYYFAGWSTSNTSNTGTSSANPWNIQVTIPHGDRGTSQNNEYENSSNPYPTVYYAYFGLITYVDVSFASVPEGCSYDITVGGSTQTVSASDVVKTHITEAKLSNPVAASGYVFAGWYQVGESGTVMDITSESPTVKFSENVTLGARFISTSTPKFKNITKGVEYYGLKMATMAASANDIIIPVAEETVVDGSDLLPVDNGKYTLPAGAKLLIPYESGNTWQILPKVVTTAATLSAYKKLILMDGVDIVVNSGAQICIGGQAMAGSGSASDGATGYTTGACGVLDMSRGGHLELNNGSTLYCWGFVKGQDMDQGNNTVGVGTITVNSGATIWEPFSVGDWRGGSATSSIVSTRFFPFQSYFMQNIEVPTTFWHGSSEWCYFTLNATGGPYDTQFAVIGSSNCLFKLTDAQSKVRTWYDPTTDLMCYELSGSAMLDELKIKITGLPLIGTIDINSSQFDLPITSNMHLILADCTMDLTKPLIIQPGAVVEIKNNATVTLTNSIYLYDKDDWGPWVNGKYFKSRGNLTTHKNRGNGASNEFLDDAKFIIDGSFTIGSSGKLYSTAGGANIMGNDGGHLTYSSSLTGSVTSLKWYKSTTTSGDGETGTVAVKSANLCNEDESYTKAIASTTFYNVHGRWFAASAKDEKANHTYDFTYISSGAVSGTGGTSSTTDAVYSWDKTGLELRQKWFNVTADCNENGHYWWHGQGEQSSWFYNWTLNSDWHQFMPTATEGMYSGSNNKIYTKTDCVWEELGETDVNCLYEIGGVKKALVDGQFIALEPNNNDPAYHAADDATKYYICFSGCNWHEATKYENAEKAYVVDEDIFIWYDGAWMNAEWRDPFFYTLDETNVPIYYEYLNGEWVLSDPYIRVIDGLEDRTYWFLDEAFAFAAGALRKTPTIKILRDISGITTAVSYTGANKTCTLDLNGHSITGSVSSMLTINGAGCTFIIEDNNTEGKEGKINLYYSYNGRRYAVNVTKGHLKLKSGTISSINTLPYATGQTSTTSCAIIVKASQQCTIEGGKVYAQADHNPFGIYGDGNSSTITVKGGEVIASVGAKSEPRGIQVTGGTLNVQDDAVIEATTYAGGTTGEGILVNSAASYFATLNMTGGIVKSTTKNSSIGILVNYNYTYDTNQPRNITAQSLPVANISGGEIQVMNANGATAEGVRSFGTTNISGGKITVRPTTTTAFGVRLYAGKTTISKTADIDVSATSTAYGVRISQENPYKTGGLVYNGTLEMTGGTLTVRTSSTTDAYGVYVGAGSLAQTHANDPSSSTYKSYYAGNYANAGTATISGGVIDVQARTNKAYAVYVAEPVSQSGATGYETATATPNCSITGGKFKVASMTANATNIAATNVSTSTYTISGGYYNNQENVAGYTTAPKHVITLPTTDANYPEYLYKVANSYLVTFMNGSETLQSTYQEEGKVPTYTEAEPTKASAGGFSYAFNGWSTSNDNTPAALTAVTSVGATYYACFEQTDLRYTISLDATTNGGECATEYIRVAPGAAAGELPSAAKEGHTFTGWFTAASGGTQLTASTVVSGDITYYAQFTVNSYTLTYALGEGKVTTAGSPIPAKNKTGTQSQSVAYGTAITAPVVARTGYTFQSWDAIVAATMPAEDVTYTPLWIPNVNTKYTVKHYLQNVDGTYPADPVETQSLTGTTATSVTPEVKSYDGFVSPATQTVTIAAAGTTVVEYRYARRHYTFTLDAYTNGGTSEVPSIEVLHGATIGAVPPDAQKGCNDFTGWYTKPVGGVKITPEFVIEYDMKTLYAQFSDDVRTYPITYNAGVNGTGAVAAGTKTCGEDATLSSSTFTRDGYTQTGWSLTDGGAKAYDLGGSYTANAALTLYPFWTLVGYQINFVDEDGITSLGDYPKTLNPGASVTVPTEPTKATTEAYTYTFAGWFDGTNTYASDAIPNVTAAATYTATYTATPNVASVTVGGATTYYTTLPLAFAYAADKTTPTIKVLADIALAAKVTYTNSSKTTVTIDLNGKTISGGANQLMTLSSGSSTGGQIIIKSSVDGGQIRNVLSSTSARSCVYLYKGKLKLESGTIYNENTNTGGSYAVLVAGSRTFTMTGGTLQAQAKKNGFGLYNYGTSTISGGSIIVNETSGGTASSVYAAAGTTTLKGTLECHITGTSGVYGAFVGGATPASDKGTLYNGTLIIEGGTFNATANSSGTAYGAYCTGNIRAINYSTSATYAGNYADAGTLQIKGGVFTVEGKTTYGVGMKDVVSISTAKDAEENATYTAASATPKATISGGKFNLKGTTTKAAVTTTATNANQLVEGGWYSDATNLATKYTAPTKNCNYHVLPLTDEDPYKYEVAEAYMITFKNGDDVLQSTAVKKGATPAYSGTTPTKAEDASYTYSFTGWSPAITTVSTAATYTATFSSTPRTYAVTLHTNGGTINAGDVTKYTYGTGATLPTNVTKDGHEFGGWFDNDGLTGDAVTSISNTATGNKEYWAKWTASIADRELDIVDWTSNSITINVTNLKAVGGTNKNNWKIYVNDKDYTRTSSECSTQSRTLTISGLTLTPNDNLLIQLKNDADVIESQHNYKIPQIYTANATLSGTPSSSVVYVYGGKLTISDDITLVALYVCPGAEVEVTDGNTLTVGKLVLRTKPWATAAISGNVTATNVYYTRIAPDGSVAYPTGQYYQFGLPYECAISDVRLSDGTTPAYNTTWILKSYNEQRRAESGTENNNWDALAADATIEAGRGYEMFSTYKYYREYYFPVTPTDNTSVDVTRHGEDKNNSGWNIVCSPLMSIYQNESDPVTGLKVSWLLTDGSYDQEWPATIWPALPFSYQASATGYLDFSTNEFNQAVSAPRRAAYKEDIQTEWLHLDVKDGNGVGDHTSVFVHPDRFEATYKTGIDVAKQSFTASRALVYSSHAYGEMAFAGVADVLLENGVALTVYSPKEQELTISMRDNEWLDRMAYVWLIDNETGAQIDLLDSDYTFEATAGTTTGRFILMGRFFAPQIATDIDEVDGEQAKPKKLIIRDKLYILINDQLYDGTGKMVK